MKLTEKTKEAFEKYYDEMRWNLDDMDFKNVPESCQNALIIEFFDSVGIRIGIAYFNVGKGYFEYRIHYNVIVGIETTRTEANNAAIIKANDLYNEKN